MKPWFDSLALSAIAMMTFATSVPAQEKPSAILNSVEVQQLVKRADPADNARLATHFTALAERYTAEAKRHTAMAQSFGTNPARNVSTGMSVHCKSLADLNTKTAATLRELSTYHQKLAAGASATPPRDGGRFQSGAGAPEPNEKELTALAAKARTPSEHGALQEYFASLAKRYTSDANEYAALAQAYRGTKLASAAVNQDRLATLARDAAKEATAAAEMHRQLGGATR